MKVALWWTTLLNIVIFGVEDAQHAYGEVEFWDVTALDQ
jgi:hypothetical protein